MGFMLDLVVFGSLCERDGLKVVSVPGRGSSSGLSQGASGVLFEFIEVGGPLWYAPSLVACSPLHRIVGKPTMVVVAVQGPPSRLKTSKSHPCVVNGNVTSNIQCCT